MRAAWTYVYIVSSEAKGSTKTLKTVTSKTLRLQVEHIHIPLPIALSFHTAWCSFMYITHGNAYHLQTVYFPVVRHTYLSNCLLHVQSVYSALMSGNYLSFSSAEIVWFGGDGERIFSPHDSMSVSLLEVHLMCVVDVYRISLNLLPCGVSCLFKWVLQSLSTLLPPAPHSRTLDKSKTLHMLVCAWYCLLHLTFVNSSSNPCMLSCFPIYWLPCQHCQPLLSRKVHEVHEKLSRAIMVSSWEYIAEIQSNLSL